MNVALAIAALYPNAAQIDDYRVSDGQITYWNAAKLGTQPSALDLARGWYLYSKQAAYGRLASGMIDAMRALVPELSGVEGAQQRPEGYVVVLLLEGMANNNPTRINAVKAERTKWGQKRAQVDAVALSASPTESEYLSKADTLNAITY